MNKHFSSTTESIGHLVPDSQNNDCQLKHSEDDASADIADDCTIKTSGSEIPLQADNNKSNQDRSKSNQVSDILPINSRLSRLRLERETIPRSALINGKYLPAPLIVELMNRHKKRVILLAAGLGLGKSTAGAAIMRDSFNGIGVAISHRRKLTSQLSGAFNAESYSDIKKLEAGAQVDRLATTIQSAEFMLNNPFCANAFDSGLLVVDESNSVAAEFTGKTVKNEAATMSALRAAISKARATLCLDAHIDSSTVNLLKAAGVSRDEILLIDVERPELEDYTVKIFETELNEKGRSKTRPALMNQVISDLKAGLKVMVASLSSNFLNELEEQVISAGLTGHIKIDGKSSPALVDSLNADTYGNYSLVMLSPAMSTGISFDKDNADTCYVYLSNGDGTGSYQDGLQAMMRDRAVKSKVINCVYEESQIPLTTKDRVLLDQARQLQAFEDYFSDNPSLQAEFKKRRPFSNETSDFLNQECLKQVSEKEHFLNMFVYECRLKGATIVHCETSELESGNITTDTLREAAINREVERLQSIVNADTMPDDICLIEDADLLAIKGRSFVESFAAVDFDKMDTESKTELVKKILPPDNGKKYVNQIRRFERALTPRAELARLTEIAVIGAAHDDSDKVNFAEKITTRKIHWPAESHYMAMILKACGVVQTENGLELSTVEPINESNIKGGTPASALYFSLIKNPDKAITCGILGRDIEYSDSAEIKAAPFQYIINMIRGAGIKLRKAQGKEQYKVVAADLQETIDLINRRKQAGINETSEWLSRIDEYLLAHQDRKARAQNLSANVSDSAPAGAVAAISKALDNIGAPHLLADAVEYLEPFHSRIESKILSMTNIQMIVNRFVDSQ